MVRLPNRPAGVIALLVLIGAPTQTSRAGSSLRPPPEEAPRVAPIRGTRLPLCFEENRGQEAGTAAFLSRGPGWELSLGPSEAVYRFGTRPVRMEFEGASPRARLEGDARLPGRSHYYLGKDPERWLRGIPQYRTLASRDLYPGIDLRWSVAGGTLEYSFVLAPGADPARIRLRFSGSDDLRLDGGGDLLVATPSGRMRQSRPVAWQDGPRGTRPVEASWRIDARDRARLEIGDHDPCLPLVIDPRHEFTTYFGVDLYLTHLTAAGLKADGTSVVGGYYTTSGVTTRNCFLAGLSADGTDLLYSVVFGGDGDDHLVALTVDVLGNLFATGYTASTNFPVFRSFQTTAAGSFDGFVLMTSQDTSLLYYSSYLGGSGDDRPAAIAVGADGTVVVGGLTASSNFPVTNALDGSLGGGGDAFLTSIAPVGTGVIYSTFLGGSQNESVQAIAIDPDGAAVVAGVTASSDFPRVAAIQGTLAGADDGFVTRVSATGDSIDFSTLLGGSGQETITGAAIATTGRIYVSGTTSSSDFPATDAYDLAMAGGSDAFVACLAPAGDAIEHATYLGSQGDEGAPVAVALDGRGRPWIAGTTFSTGLPVSLNAVQPTAGGGSDAFLAQFDPTLSFLLYGSYLGGSGDETGLALAATPEEVLLVGTTRSSNLPTKFAVQTQLYGTMDGMIFEFSLGPKAPTNLTGDVFLGSNVMLHWTDNSDDEDGWRIERSTAGGAWEVLVASQPQNTGYLDTGLARSTLYEYRIRATNDDGESLYSNIFPLVTPPPAPAPPTSLLVSIVTASSVHLQWSDESDNETTFSFERRRGIEEFAPISTVPAGIEEATDSGLLPGRTYTWRVQARNPGGGSPYTNEVSATMPTTLITSWKSGKITDSAKPGKDAFRVAGTWSFADAAADSFFTPYVQGLTVSLEPEGSAVLFSIPPGDTRWKQRKDTFTWKSEKKARPRIKVVVKPSPREISISVADLDLDIDPEAPIDLWIDSGNDAGSHSAIWDTGRPGVLTLP